MVLMDLNVLSYKAPPFSLSMQIPYLLLILIYAQILLLVFNHMKLKRKVYKQQKIRENVKY